MIRLFKDVWLCHDYETEETGLGFPDRETGDKLVGDERDAMWLTLIMYEGKRNIFCSEETFMKVFIAFFSNVLKLGYDPATIKYLLNLYLLDQQLKYKADLQFPSWTESNIRDGITLYHGDPQLVSAFEPLTHSDFGFEFMLPTWIITGEPRDAVLRYTKWCCWTILATEFHIYNADITRDVFNAHHITGSLDLNLINTNPREVYSKVSRDWRFVFDKSLLKIFPIEKLDEGIANIKRLFPTADDMLKIFNNHAIAHRDHQCVDSFREPVTMIYDDKYERLLVRDMGNEARITYASEHLADITVCTYLSAIYYGFKHGNIDHAMFRTFELK